MIRLIKSTFYNEQDTKNKLVDFVQKAEILSFGQECIKFEEAFANWQGREHCMFVNSGSSAKLGSYQARRQSWLLGSHLVNKRYATY